MVNNSDRIKTEIKKQANQIALENNIDPGLLSDLTMQIVDLVDDHSRKRNHCINQAIEDKLTTVARNIRVREV